jgi:uncharacterized membrane protein
MTTTREPAQKMDAYLSRLRGGLRGMSDDHVRDIVEELRSHITDKLASGEASTVEAVLAALGSPEDLASQYVTDDLFARAEASRSPLRVLRSLFRWATLSVAGFFVLLGSIIGYFLGVAFILVAVLKPFHPQTAGLWILRDSVAGPLLSFRLGFGVPPGDAKEVLGWWIVPLGLIAGCGLLILTTRFALWCARQYRKSRTLPRMIALDSEDKI